MREDRYSNDLDGAAGWQAYHGRHDDDRPSRHELAMEAEEDPEDEDTDDCRCSDPGCPCSGPKREGAP